MWRDMRQGTRALAGANRDALAGEARSARSWTMLLTEREIGMPYVKSCGGVFAAIVVSLGLLFFAGQPAVAQALYSPDLASQIKGTTPQVRAKLRTITNSSRAQMRKIFAKYKIVADATPSMNKLISASGELQQVGSRERLAVSGILKPDQMAQYNAIISATRKRIMQLAK